ncbi:hypothetical protein CIB48_g10305 [Xylaria polymorpha]|nr:hypothetical protein CIB48_g10305 [Xylaria polymorpha]
MAEAINPLPSTPRKDAEVNDNTESQDEKQMEGQPSNTNQEPCPLVGNMAPGSPAKDHGHPPTRYEREQETVVALQSFQLYQRGPKDQEPEGDASVNDNSPSPIHSNGHNENSDNSQSPACHDLNGKEGKRAAADNHIEDSSKKATESRTALDEPNECDAEAEKIIFTLHPSQTQGMQLLPPRIPQGDSTATAQNPSRANKRTQLPAAPTSATASRRRKR